MATVCICKATVARKVAAIWRRKSRWRKALHAPGSASPFRPSIQEGGVSRRPGLAGRPVGPTRTGPAPFGSCLLHRQSGADQPHVGEGLGEVAQGLAILRVDLLREKKEVVGAGEHPA